jgi:flagellar hook-length control protein FliK
MISKNKECVLPVMPIDSLIASPAPSANAANTADPPGTGETAQSFQATLAKEIRTQGSDARNETAAARKPEHSAAEDASQPADPAQADLLLPSLLKPPLAATGETGGQGHDPSGPEAGSETRVSKSPIELIDTVQAQFLRAEQLQPENATPAKLETELDDPAKARKGGFRQGLDHALQQAAANKSGNAAPATPTLPGSAAADKAPGLLGARSNNDAMAFAKAIGQTREEAHAARQDTAAAALQTKDSPKSPDGLKHDAIANLSGEIHDALNVQAASAQRPSELSPAAARLDARIGTEAWSSALGQQVILMVAGQQQQAEIHLNPESLGPIKVTITLDNSQASLSFVAREASVRDAIESSLPKLTSMMSESGISLGQTQVSADNSGNSAPWSLAQTSAANLQNRDASEAENALPATSPRARVQQGLIDTFA